MELVLNDFSLNGQFCSIEDFLDNLKDDIVPLLDFCVSRNWDFYKTPMAYDLKITDEITLYDSINGKSTYPELQLFISNLSNIMDEPYYNEDVALTSNLSAEYTIDLGFGFPNCFLEASRRTACLISFKHNNFADKYICIEKNKIKEQIKNAVNLEMFSEHLIETKTEKFTFVDFLKSSKYDLQVKFADFSVGEFLSSEDMFKIRSDLKAMITSVVSGNYTRRTGDAISHKGEKFFPFKSKIDNNEREFRMYYITKGTDYIFVYAYIKKDRTISNKVKDLVVAGIKKLK